MVKFKIPKSIKIGLKIFGIFVGLIVTLNSVKASIKGNLPISTTSDEFPQSYRLYIEKLKEIYPNAIFKAVYTGLDWNLVVKHESYEVKKGISLIPSSYSAVWKKDGKNTYMDGYFVIASKSAVAYLLDPRNSLYEREVFQFEGLSYNPNITTPVIEKVIVSSPMVGTYSNKYKNAGNWVEMDMSYAEIIDKVGKETGVSSVYIASRLIQETSGDIVNNGSINGSNKTYPGIYNFFNIGATPNADGSGAVTNGLKYAKAQGWTTPYLSILGGTEEIKSSYIKYGQDTVYFQKFDVNNPYGNASSLMAYQYQTNIMAPTSESRISYRAYQKLDMLDTAFTFYVPVYNNMPEDPAPYPAGDSAKFVTDNTKVYLDDEIKDGTDEFNIRSSASSELDNIIYVIKEDKEGADNRIILNRTKKGDGYDFDYVEVEVDGQIIKGYVWSEYVKEYQYTKVEGITLDKTEHIFEVGETCKLTATITPDDAKFKDVIWTSNNENIVKVEEGNITAIGVGTAVITATTKDMQKTATCTVTVNEKTYDIILDKEEYLIEEEQKVKPVITLKNIDAYELKIVDETVACIVDGEIKGLKPGETVLEVHGTGTEIIKTAKVIVTEIVREITLDKEEYIIEEEQKVKPVITLKNIDAYELKILDETVACIVDGEIKGLKPGETVLEVYGTGTEIVKTAKVIVTEKIIIEVGYKLHESLNLSETKVLTNVSTNTTVRDLKAKIELTNLTLEIKSVNGEVLTEEQLVGTDTTLVFYKEDGSQYDAITIVILGEVTGDGIINSGDLFKTVRFLKGNDSINEQAADVTKDGIINSGDLFKTVRFLKGNDTINFN